MLTAMLVLILVTASGCSTRRSDGFAFRTQHLDGIEVDAAFRAAEEAVGDHFVIASRDKSAGVLRSGAERKASEGPARRRRAAATRKVAEVRVSGDGASTQVSCKVVVFENKSYGVHSVNRMRGVDDQPTSTPAERDAGMTREQNEVWIAVRRDVVMERTILRKIRRLTGLGDDVGPVE